MKSSSVDTISHFQNLKKGKYSVIVCSDQMDETVTVNLEMYYDIANKSIQVFNQRKMGLKNVVYILESNKKIEQFQNVFDIEYRRE